MNDVQAEITAVEDALKNGIQHALTVNGTLTVSTGGMTVSTGSVNIGGPSSLASLNVNGGSTLAGLHVTSTATFDSSVTVSGNLTVSGALTVGSLSQTIPAVRLSLASDLQLAVVTEMSPNWTVQDFSVGGMHSTTTNSSRITFAHSTGLYAVGVTIGLPNSGTVGASRRVRLRYNDTTPLGAVTGEGVSSLTVVAISLTDTVRAASTTDYVTVRFAYFDDALSTSRLISGVGGSASSLVTTTFWAYKVS